MNTRIKLSIVLVILLVQLFSFVGSSPIETNELIDENNITAEEIETKKYEEYSLPNQIGTTEINSEFIEGETVRVDIAQTDSIFSEGFTEWNSYLQEVQSYGQTFFDDGQYHEMIDTTVTSDSYVQSPTDYTIPLASQYVHTYNYDSNYLFYMGIYTINAQRSGTVSLNTYFNAPDYESSPFEVSERTIEIDIDSTHLDQNGFAHIRVGGHYFLDCSNLCVIKKGYTAVTLEARVTSTGKYDTTISHGATHVFGGSFGVPLSVYLKVDLLSFAKDDVVTEQRSEYKYTNSQTKTHKLEIENFDYNTEIRMYTPLYWDFAFSETEVTVTWDAVNEWYEFSNTVPLTYVMEFTSNTSSLISIDNISSKFGQNGFEAGNNSWFQSTINDWDSAFLDTSRSSHGSTSMKLIDTDSTADDLELNISSNGLFYISFDYYIESWSAGDLQLRWFNSYGGTYSTETLETGTTDRWFRAFVEVDMNRTIQIRRTAASGSATFYIDNFRFYENNIYFQTLETNKQSINGYMISWDGYDDPVIPFMDIYINLTIPSMDSLVEEWSTITDVDGIYQVIHYGELEQQDYRVFVGANNFTSYLATPIQASLILTDQDFQYNFDTRDYSFLYQENVTTTFNTTSTIADITGDSSKHGIIESQITTTSISYSINARMKLTSSTGYFGLFFFNSTQDYVLARVGTTETIFKVGGIETNPVQLTNIDTWYNFRIDVTNTQIKWYIDNNLVATRINTNSLVLPSWGVIVFDSQIEVDFFRLLKISDPQIFQTDTQTIMTSTDDNLIYDVYLDGQFIGQYPDLYLIPLNVTIGIHNLTVVAAMNLLYQYEPYIPDLAGKIEFIYSTFQEFFVSVYSFELSSFIISTFVVSNYNGNYTAYENDTSIGVGNFVDEGTAIVTNRDLTPAVIIYYSILFQNDTDQLWFNVTYSNAETVVVEEGGLSIEGIVNPDYDFGSNLVALFISTNWANTTVSVYQNDTLIGSSPEGQAIVFTFNGDYGVWNFTYVINGTADYFSWEEWISILTPDLSLTTVYYDIVVLDLEGYIFQDFPLISYYNATILSRNLLPLRGDEFFNSTLLTFGNDQSFNFQAHNITVSQSASANIFVVLVYIDILKIYFENAGSYLAQLNVTSTLGDWSLEVNETILVPQGGRSYWLPEGNYSAEIFEVVADSNLTTSTGFISEMRVSSSLSLSGGERTYDASTTRLGAEIDNNVSILQDPFFAIGAGISSALLIFFVLNKVGDELYLWFRTNILRRPRNEPLQFKDFKNIDINPTSNRAQNQDNRRRKRNI